MTHRIARLAAPLLLAAVFAAGPGCMQARQASVVGGGSAAIVMVNQTDAPIYYVYISPCSSNDWGEDQLGSSEVVQPGATRTFTMSPGCWSTGPPAARAPGRCPTR
jgi:hypothetical protein